MALCSSGLRHLLKMGETLVRTQVAIDFNFLDKFGN